jgi:D-alanyl-D-alanine dipeptidase
MDGWRGFLMSGVFAIFLALTLSLAGCGTTPATVPSISSARTAEEAGMVSLQSLVPDIRLDMRYAGSDNFVGRRIAGYEAPRCYLQRSVAEALQRVEQALRPRGLRLQIFDCYRPVRAVQDFMAWAADLDDQRSKAQFYPGLPKTALVPGYIAERSGHSRGATVDLTLLRCDTDGQNCTPLDMGTPFDFFDPLAHTDAPGATAQQRENRHLLREAMAREGFRNYPQEWWHYTLRPEPTPTTAYDFPVR